MGMDLDQFLPDQLCGITCQVKRLHGVPREGITLASYGQNLQTCICEKSKWTPTVFHAVDWDDFHRYLKSLENVK